MKVRAAALGFVAMVVLCATPSVGVAEAKEPTKTVEVEEAGISLAYPASWIVITGEYLKGDDEWRRENPDIADSLPMTQFVARSRQRYQRSLARWRAQAVVETSDIEFPSPPETPELSLKEFRDNERSWAKQTGEQFLGASKQMVGSDVAYRLDVGHKYKVRDGFVTIRRSQLTFTHDGVRNIVVKVATPVGEEGKALTDRIMGSVKAL